MHNGENASSLEFKTDAQVEELSRYSSNGAGGFIYWNIRTDAQVRDLNRHSATEQMEFFVGIFGQTDIDEYGQMCSPEHQRRPKQPVDRHSSCCFCQNTGCPAATP